MTDLPPFNPLDMANLGESITTAMLRSEPTPMLDLRRFNGAGIYAIYYTGDLPMYSLLADANRDGQFGQPIYVGKAVPAGARKGVLVGTSTRALGGRLAEHAASINAATNLDPADFHCRWLIVEPIWIPLGESLLIGRFAPVWNTIVDGFGNHDPGKGRQAGMVSRWDVLHPGRSWVHKFVPRTETAATIEADVTEYLRARIQV
jgi:hypothetical protein